jgi:hypothetical protein
MKMGSPSGSTTRHRAARTLDELTGPLVRSFAFARLENITFLGILSPRFAHLPGFPFKFKDGAKPCGDGTRADHSKAVAALVLEITNTLGFSEKATKYGLAWALLHDISTWPLSHTGEAAFSSICKISADSLRTLMIMGSDDLPQYLVVRHALKKALIAPEHLLMLFDKKTNHFLHQRSSLSRELSILWRILNSPLTPDTLEGMQRSGQVFGVRVPEPGSIIKSFAPDLFEDAFIERQNSKTVLEFWRAKSKIYRSFINTQRAIAFESKWAIRIESYFSNASLTETLLFPENCLVEATVGPKMPTADYYEKRYKPPLSYFVASPYKRKRMLSHGYKIDDLSNVLAKARKSRK